MIDEGTNVVSLIATDGSGSTTIMELSGEEMAEVRRQEAREAVSVLGIQTLIISHSFSNDIFHWTK